MEHDKLTDSDVGESIQRSRLGCGGNSCRELFTSLNGLIRRESSSMTPLYTHYHNHTSFYTHLILSYYKGPKVISCIIN